ncbi:MAG: nitroreductase family protein [Erysipelotrichaceae bacterium]|nr:nitroreductase family protein [Erysipelotrichaceae bacterium]
MTLHDLYTGERTYRRYLQKEISHDTLLAVMENVRLAHCAGNMQKLTFAVVTDPALRDQMAQQVHFAAYLPKEIGQPKPGEEAMAYVVIIKPKDKYPLGDIDAGIAAEVITSSAWEQGVGSCIMLNFNAAKVNELLQIPDDSTARIVIAMGYPAHTSTVVEMNEAHDVKYYVDDEVNYYVPKRALEDLVQWK